MSIGKELLELLVCPETHATLSLADEAMVARLNEAISSGRLKNKVGQLVEQRLDAALIRADGRVAYPVVDGIPVMLIDDSIPLEQLDGPAS